MTVIDGEVVENTARRIERNAARTPEVLPPDVDTKVVALSRLDSPELQARAVTTMLSHARTGLLAAIAAQDLPEIVEFKRKAAAIQEIVKQIRLGKDMELDSAEFVRRAERGLGVAIREGQEDGKVMRRGDSGGTPTPGVRGSIKTNNDVLDKARPTDFASRSELAGYSGDGIYAMTDGVSEEAFEEALAEARAEENLSRANVARKAKAKTSQQDCEPSTAPEPGASTPKKTAHARRTIEMLSVTASNLALSVAEIDPTEVDHEAMKSEIDIIFESLGAVRSFLRKVNQQ